MPLTQVQKEVKELIGTIATTSGLTVTLSGLDLTNFKSLQFVFNGVSASGASGAVTQNGNQIAAPIGGAGDNELYGVIDVDLVSGFAVSEVAAVTVVLASAAHTPYIYQSGLSVGSTSVSFTAIGAYDAGSITVYGLRA